MASPPSYLSGTLYMAAASIAMALVGTSVKWATDGLPSPVVVFFRNLFGLLALAPWLAAPGGIEVRTRHLKLHAVRCVFGFLAMQCYFFAISRLHLGSAVALNFTSPLWIPFIARIWLGEPLTKRVLAASLAGLLGVWMIRTPESGVWSAAGALGLLSAVFASAALVGVRRLTLAGEPAGRIVFYFALGSTLFTAIPLPFAWKMPTAGQWAALAATGALASAAQFLLSRGFARAPAAVAAVAYYGTVPAAAFFGWLIWGEPLTPAFIIGATLICGAGIAASLSAEREARSSTDRRDKSNGVHPAPPAHGAARIPSPTPDTV
ncbi:MAG: DMT family transporter [Kiritimatiellae bacterium]|nr:DMT family transporter [Kiritimatiellia bacterium]MDW8458803.1 DMT family transporter [Verrucomicrobiota bacterium]